MQLKDVSVPCADDLPSSEELHTRAVAAFDDLETVLAGGTLEEKREMIGHYVLNDKGRSGSFSDPHRPLPGIG